MSHILERCSAASKEIAENSPGKTAGVFLTRRVDFECGGDAQLAAKVRARILKAEDLKIVCKKIRYVVAPQQSAGLTSVLIPVDHENPKQATVWKKIDDPREVVALIQARNKKHLRLLDGQKIQITDKE
jgi:hypothetical protein